tara:strand:+ start:354 stop:1403 length:1050 start_codon:yes stop_codon:yes gene_type:complete
MSAIMAKSIDLVESGLIPDIVIRAGIRKLLNSKLKKIHSEDLEWAANVTNDFVEMMNSSPIALLTDTANEQHYEVPADFYPFVMGDHLKYSCCEYSNGVSSLSEAESQALKTTTERAGIEDGMKVLDLGCGWGSLSLWIAEKFPNSQVTSVSNSSLQADYINKQAKDRSLSNINVITCDMNTFDTEDNFDKVVSIEMFEHMRNYEELYRRINNWLRPGGNFFMHIFCHKTTPYEYQDEEESDWMSRHFFSGGIMPSADLPLRFTKDLNIVNSWYWNGKHYAKTCNAWLKNMDKNIVEIKKVIEDCYEGIDIPLWCQRRRVFFMACAELFDYNDGNEWFVGHYLFQKKLG